MYTYIYEGPVYRFDKCVENHYIASTRAPSEKKAINNIAYRYKTNNDLNVQTKITLPGKITIKPNYNPVYEAYHILTSILFSRDSNDISRESLMLAIEESIGYLGEALDE